MKRLLAIAAAASLMGCPAPENAVYSASSAAASAATNDHLRPIVERYQYRGDLRISGGALDGARKGKSKAWPWASVTKQVIAVMVMQEVDAGRIDLDAPASDYISDWPRLDFGAPTVRQLLQHQSGLNNPEAVGAAAEIETFYETGQLSEKFCLLEMRPPGGEWRYNNCDYVMLAVLLERVNGMPLNDILQPRVATPSGWSWTEFHSAQDSPGFVGDTDRLRQRIEGYGAAAGLVGTLDDMIRFDRALLSGRILADDARAIMWESDPSLGYMALGQWAFDAPLDGCEDPTKIIERRGAIGDYQIRNILLPDVDDGIALAFANKDGDFAFGEIWSGEGFLFDTVSAAACA